MPNSITITSIEHLPSQATLLIRYNITSAGRWNFDTRRSAYRDASENNWTLIYPNSEDSRHTSFPILVNSGATVSATFAWKYDGIRGIGASNFDDAASYYIQLTIFDSSGDVLVPQDPIINPTAIKLPPIVVPPIRVYNSTYIRPPKRNGDPPPPPPIRVPIEPPGGGGTTGPGDGVRPRPRPLDWIGGIVIDPQDPQNPTRPIKPNIDYQYLNRPFEPQDPGWSDPGGGEEPAGGEVLGETPVVVIPVGGNLIPGTNSDEPAVLGEVPVIQIPDAGTIITPGGGGDPVDPYPGDLTEVPAGGDVLGEVPVVFIPNGGTLINNQQPVDPYPGDSPDVIASEGGEFPVVVLNELGTILSSDLIVIRPPGRGVEDPPIFNNYPGDTNSSTSIVLNGEVILNSDGETLNSNLDTRFRPSEVVITAAGYIIGTNSVNTIEGGDASAVSIDLNNPSVNTRPPVADITNLIVDVNNPISVGRPAKATFDGVGESSSPNTFQSNKSRTLATSTDGPSIPGLVSKTSSIDIGSINSTTSVTEGYLTKYNYSNLKPAVSTTDINISHIDTSAVIPGSRLQLDISAEDVQKGNSLIIGSSYNVPEGVAIRAVLELWLVDAQGRNVKLISQTSKYINYYYDTKLSYALSTSDIPAGPSVVVALVKDINNKVVGVTSKQFNVRPTLIKLSTDSNLRVRQPSETTTAFGLPASVVDLLKINKNPTRLYISNGKGISLLLTKVDKTENKVGLLLVSQTKNSAQTYSMTVYQGTKISSGGKFTGPSPITIDGDQNIFTQQQRPKLAQSTTRLLLDGTELQPLSHTVGIPPFDTTENQLLVIIGPDSKTASAENREFDLYVGSSYVVKEFTVTVSAAIGFRRTINGASPYPNQKLGLIIHGKDPQNIPEDYAIQYANTDVNGEFRFANIEIQSGDYYSIIVPIYNQFNAYKGKAFTAKL